MGRYVDPRLKQYINERKSEAQKKATEEKKLIQEELSNLENQINKSKKTKITEFKKIPKENKKKLEQENQQIQKRKTDLEKKLQNYSKKPEGLSRNKSGIDFSVANIQNKLSEKTYEKEYFTEKSNEISKMIDNVVKSNPDKFDVDIKKDKKGNILEYNLINKEKQSEMNDKLYSAKSPEEEEKIKKEYKNLVNYEIKDPLQGYITKPGSNPGWSTGNQLTMLGPVVLNRFINEEPFIESGVETLKTVGIKAKATTGNNGFFSGIKGALGGISNIADMSSNFLGDDMGIKIKIKKPKITVGKNITKPLEKIVQSGAKGITSQADVLKSLAKGDIKGAAGESLGILGDIKDVAKSTASLGLSGLTAPSKAIGEATGIKPLTRLSKDVEAEGERGIEKYGDVALDVGANIATGGTYGAATSLAGGLAEGGLGSILTPENIAKYGSSALASQLGIDPNLVQAGAQMGLSAAKGDLRGVAGAGLGSAASTYGGDIASKLGIDPETLQKATEISKSALSGDVKSAALQQLGSTAGLSANQTGLLSSLSSGNLEQEAIRQAGGAAGLTKEQIQLGTSIAKGDTKGLTKMATDYVIKKGDSFNAIAKKLGVDPKELAKANPQLKDISKIAAGATLKLPKSIQSAIQDIPDESFSTQPIAGETVQQYADRMGIDSNIILERNKGKGLSLGKPIPRGTEMSLPEGFKPPTGEKPSMWESIKSGAGKAWESVKEGAGKAKEFAAENKELLGTGVQAGAAYMGYKAGKEGLEEAQKYAKQQLQDVQTAGAPYLKMSFDPERYKQEREFLQQRIAGGGYTPEERKMQQEGDIRAARAAAAQRLAGMETQARLGGAGLGTAQLAASLSGAQGAQNIQAETGLAREASAQQKMEQALQRQGLLSTQKTQEEAGLAGQQGSFQLSKAQQAAGARGELGNIAMGKASALQKLYGTGADVATNILGRLEVPEKQEQSQIQEVAPDRDLSIRAGAAGQISTKPFRPTGPRAQVTKDQSSKDLFNVKNATAGIKPTEALKNPKAAIGQVTSNIKQMGQGALQQGQKQLLEKGKEKAKEFLPSWAKKLV